VSTEKGLAHYLQDQGNWESFSEIMKLLGVDPSKFEK